MSVNRYEADLHIHTLVSPCAEVEMIPSLIMAAAEMAGLDIIAIADHNSCENAGAVIRASESSHVTVLPGLEVQSVEGVHLLCLFDTLDGALRMQERVYASLPDVAVAQKTIQEQMVVDSVDEFERYCERPLSFPTQLDIYDVFEQAATLGGMVIPSHIDRHGTGLCTILGMVPDSPCFDALEISANISEQDARAKLLGVGDRPILQNSDAHWLSAIGQRRSVFYLEHRSVSEIRMACRGEGGRRVADA